MRLLEKLSAPFGCLVVVCYWGFGLLHLWTIILSYKTYGFIGAIIASVAVMVAELFWAYRFWLIEGFYNWYTLVVAAIIVIFSAASLVMWITENAYLFKARKPGDPETPEEALENLRALTKQLAKQKEPTE
jgi:hypothetical protein